MPVIIVSLLAFSSCRKKLLTKDAEIGDLAFSEDTIRFDTLFTTFQSPTERLYVENEAGRAVTIKRIYLRNGDDSEFEVIIDGMEADEVIDFQIRRGDSLIIFIKMKSTEQDQFARDQLVFETTNGEEIVELEAFVLDAFFYSYESLPCITVWDRTKPVIVDGIVRVEEGCTLVVQEGTQVHFTSRKDANFNLTSLLDVHGTLLAWGQPGNEVVFQNSRFDEDYVENPGQWRGIRFFTPSKDSELNHVIVKNAAIGIEVDSSSVNANPKLKIRNSEVRNMSLYGIAAIGASDVYNPNRAKGVLAENLLVHNCNTANVALLFGGEYQFDNCTFANYSINFSRNSPLVLLNNYFEDTAGVFRPFVLDAEFNNSIIWGSEEEEIAKDTFPNPGLFEVRLSHTLAKTSLSLAGDNNIFISEGSSEFPQFVAPTESDPVDRDYRLDSLSPVIGQGKDLGAEFNDDKDATIRTIPWDLGCYESNW